MAAPRILVVDRSPATPEPALDPVGVLSGAFPECDVVTEPGRPAAEAVVCVVAVGDVDADAVEFLRTSEAPLVYVGEVDDRVPAGVLAAGVTECCVPAAVEGAREREPTAETDARRERLRTIEQRYRRMVEQDLFGIYIIQGGLIRFANRRAAELFGYEPEEMVDRLTAFDVVDPDDHDRLRENIRKREEGEVAELRYELTGVRKDGTRFEFEVHSGVVEYEGDPALLGAIIDITDRKRRRQRLRVLNRVLRHNLRNDLNVVIGRMEDAVGRLRDHGDDRGAEVVGRGLDEARGLVSTSEKLRKIQATLDRDARDEPVIDAAEAVDRSVTAARESYPAATVVTDLPDRAPVRADRAFDLVVENLVENAIEHNGDDPVVEVTLTELDRGRGNWYELSVADDGAGISKQEQVVVDESVEVTPLRHSSGVGLWTVAWVVQSFDGSVDIEADDGGTVVTVRLRAAD
jgi:PAS domain S-box-containing protein